MKKDILYDIEDDIIDRGDSTNLKESGVSFIIQEPRVDEKAEALNQKNEEDYHNTYYLGNHKYGRREIKMSNKAWHKLQLANGLVQNEQGIYV